MRAFEIRKYSPTGPVIGTVQANTATGAKQKWRTKIRDESGDSLGQSYWHMHVVVEAK